MHVLLGEFDTITTYHILHRKYLFPTQKLSTSISPSTFEKKFLDFA